MNRTDIEYGIQRQDPIKNVSDRNKCLLALSTVIHLVYSAYYVFVFAYGFYICHLALSSGEDLLKFMATYSFAFGTNWNLTFQAMFQFLTLIYDVLEWFSKHKSVTANKIAYWRDVLFNALVVPYTLFVSIMFWCIYTIDRELVFPKVYDVIIPWWFNHCVHTNIAVIVLVETLLTARKYPTCRSLELKINFCIGFGYAVIYYTIYYFTNRWLYNVFGVMTWWQVCLYQLLIWSSCFFFYFIHFPINRIVHGSEYEGSRVVETDDKSIKEAEHIDYAIEKNFDIPGKNDSLADTWSLQHKYGRENEENSRL